jgi:GTPase SAR1 family protein
MTGSPSRSSLSFVQETGAPRRPRIALMGEFSAGKSTLANLMIGSDPLPVQVIATQLPPVWISYGDDPAFVVDMEGRESPCDLKNLMDLDIEETAFIRIFCEEDILKVCDIIDLPGISDPNMTASVWERILPLADGVVWCSPATQAWRQSEAAAWEGISETLQRHSILLLTRADMLVSERDKEKVMRRVRAETKDLFAECLMISLMQARDAGDDPDEWEQSGAEQFVNAFLAIVGSLKDRLGSEASEFDFALDARKSKQPDEMEGIGHDYDPDRIVPRRPVLKARKPRPAPPVHIEDEESYMPKFS